MLLFFRKVRLKNYVNILSIIATLPPSASRRRWRFWRLLVVVGVLASSPRCLSSRQRLVVVSVLLFPAASSLLVAVSVGFCVSLSLSLSLGLLLSLVSRCCYRIWFLVVGAGVVECLIVSSVPLSSLSSACCYWRQWHLVVVGSGGGVMALSEKLSLY